MTFGAPLAPVIFPAIDRPSAGFVTRFEYDANQNRTAVIDPLGFTNRTMFNNSGDPVAQIDPLLLPVLWELNPRHPNLLPAFETPHASLRGNYVKKPRLSREGANVSIFERNAVVEENGGDYGGEGFIYQALGPIPNYSGNRPVFGVWMVNHEACGLGVREDTRQITGNHSRFVPHRMG